MSSPPTLLAAFCFGLLLAGSAGAQNSVSTDPIGVRTLLIRGASDNVISLPMEQPVAFAGTVQAATSTTLTVAAGILPGGAPRSPNWAPAQFVFNAAAGQHRTFLAEFASGALKGVYYKIIANSSNTLTLDTEGDNLTAHSLGSVAVSDSLRIRSYNTVRDVFEANGAPLLESRPDPFSPRDDVLIPSSLSVGINKAPSLTIYHLAGQGWRAAGQGSADFSDYALQPNEGIIVRRRKATDVAIVNAGAAAIIRSVSFVPGGDGSSGNDTYIAFTHPVPVTLDQSGLRNANQASSVVKDSTSDFLRQDELLAFAPSSQGFNVAPSMTYYYRAGQGWKQVGGSGIVGATVTLQPGTAYIVRKKAQNPGVDWVKDPNF